METSLDPERAEIVLGRQAAQWWRAWDAERIARTCSEARESGLPQGPEVAYWRGLSAFMTGASNSLTCLDDAYAGYAARGDSEACRSAADAALTICLCDIGAMDQVNDWLSRAKQLANGAAQQDDLWSNLGVLSRAVLGAESALPSADAARWLRRRLASSDAIDASDTSDGATLSSDERLLAAQVLVDYNFHIRNYSEFDTLISLVESGPTFTAASALMRCRWWYTIGMAQYQTDDHARAESAWIEALRLSRAHNLGPTSLLVSLAMLRLLIDRRRAAEARRLERTVDQGWGVGRESQLILLRQMRARLLMLEGQVVRAHSLLTDALAKAAEAHMPAPELASCKTDLVQYLIAQQEIPEADSLLMQMMRDHRGRDRRIFLCLMLLFRAHSCAMAAKGASAANGRHSLARGLALARKNRYTMFFRLLPDIAADLCLMALQSGIETVFVSEVVRNRELPAPATVGPRWPWPLWIRMTGTFEIRRHGDIVENRGKSQVRTLDLLKLLASQRPMSMGMLDAADALCLPPEGAQASIEATVRRLRLLLGDETLVRVEDNRVMLDSRRVCSDVFNRREMTSRLQTAVSKVRGLRAGETLGDAVDCRLLLTEIRELGLADLLPDRADDTTPWIAEARRLCAQDEQGLVLAAAELMRHYDAEDVEQELLEFAMLCRPANEKFALRLVELYALNGLKLQAQRAYDTFVESLEESGSCIGEKADGRFQKWLRLG